MCEKHPESGGMVCGEFRCGACYGEALEAEPYRPAKPTGELVYGTRDGHTNTVFLGVRKDGVFESHAEFKPRTAGGAE